jgi:tetratricopeptide (TPR) repeat protein
LLGLVAGRRGDFARAHELLARARVELERQGARNELAEVDLTAIEVLLRERRGEEALELLDRLLADESGRAALEPFAPSVRRLRGVALLQLGDRDAGRDLLVDALAVAREEGSAYETALLLDLLADTDVDADAKTAARRRAEASDLFGALGVSRVVRCPV